MEMKVGIIGFGFMGRWHADHITEVEGIQVVAVSDIKEEHLNNAKARGLKAYRDYRELLSDSEVNTVIISAPNYLHKEMSIAAANSKKNIVCEKPAAMNVQEFDEMTEAAEKNKVIFSVHQNRRWDADFITAKKVFDENLIGDVFTIESRLYGANGLVHDWHVFKKYGGGMIYDWGVHLFDQMLQMIPGKLKTVFADVRNVINEEVDDYFKTVFLFENGIAFRVELGTYMLDRFPRWYMAGDKGTLVIKSFFDGGEIIRSRNLLEKLPATVAATMAGPTRSMAPPPEGTLVTEQLPLCKSQWTEYYKNYLDVLNGEDVLAVRVNEVRRVLKLMETVRLSAEKKQSVSFE